MMQLIVNENWNTGFTSFYLMIDEGRQRVVIGQKDGQLVEHRPEPGTVITMIDPLLHMPLGYANEFLKAVANYLSDKNIKTENENLLQGRLNATERHLEDMRTYFGKALDKIINTSENV